MKCQKKLIKLFGKHFTEKLRTPSIRILITISSGVGVVIQCDCQELSKDKIAFKQKSLLTPLPILNR